MYSTLVFVAAEHMSFQQRRCFQSLRSPQSCCVQHLCTICFVDATLLFHAQVGIFALAALLEGLYSTLVFVAAERMSLQKHCCFHSLYNHYNRVSHSILAQSLILTHSFMCRWASSRWRRCWRGCTRRWSSWLRNAWRRAPDANSSITCCARCVPLSG